MELKDISVIPATTIGVKCALSTTKIETENIVGFLQGNSDSSLIITAHYDHLGGNGDTYFPGADDNASGVAAMLEIAEAFAHKNTLGCNIIFLATTAEEEGMIGSDFYVNDTIFDSARIALNVNLDMLGRIDNKHSSNECYIYSVGTDEHNNLKELQKQATAILNNGYYDYSMDKTADLSGFYHRADQYNFYSKGVSAILFTSGLHDDYHKPTDSARLINYRILENRAKLIFITLDLIQESIGNHSHSHVNLRKSKVVRQYLLKQGYSRAVPAHRLADIKI